MRIKAMNKGPQATTLEIDTGDPKDQRFHIIPAGVLETRMEAWDLNEDEALNLLLVEAQDVELPDRFEAEDLDAARNQVKAAIAKASIDWGVAKADVLKATALPADVAAAVREHTRAELAQAVRPMRNPSESLVENVAKGKEVGAGYERLSEEYLADEFVADLPDEKRNAPRDAGEPESVLGQVPLRVNFTD